MTKAADISVSGPLSCGGEGQAAPDSKSYRIIHTCGSCGSTMAGSMMDVSVCRYCGTKVAVTDARSLEFAGGGLRMTILFLEPRDNPRAHRSDTLHAALASLPWRVAGEGGAYDLPPSVFIEPVNPAHVLTAIAIERHK